MGSRTIFAAAMMTRSRTQGMDSGRNLPAVPVWGSRPAVEVSGHAALVANHDVPVGEGEGPVLEPPGERGDGPRVHPGPLPEGFGCLPRRGGPQDGVAGGFEPGPHRRKRGGFPRSRGSYPDLYLGFRGTQGLGVSGVGAVLGAEYVGELTYVIQDAYGVGVHDYLLGAGPQMRYLQTTGGAPFYPGGAHWFPDSITVTARSGCP
jgi:hypothetical protein